MTDTVEDVIRSILLPSEEVKAVLEALVVPRPGLPNNTSPVVVQERNKRILAVVSRLYAQESDEQGCLFIFKPNLSPTGAISDLVIDNVIPIVGDFSISMAQSKRNTIYLRNPTPALTLNQPRTEMTLTINPGQLQFRDQWKGPISFLTNDLQHLRSVLAECKRLKKITGEFILTCPPSANSLLNAQDTETESISVPSRTSGSNYSWIIPYTSASSSVFSTVPPDLRIDRLPLHTRLSPASAGLPGDDLSDIHLMREQWVMDTAREFYNNNMARSDLRIRMGTFNVNGKMPSQDLSTWVRGNQGGIQEKVTPPKNTSLLFVGDVGEGPESVSAIDPKPESLVDQNGAYFTSRSNEASKVFGGISTTQQSNQNTIGREYGEDLDPDMLVLAFQELDLSAEALLYSTKTTREDAWTLAIFASLGEKADMYEKLVSKQLVGMLLIIIVRKSLKDCFSDIKACSVGAGIMGLMGNKGGTALRVTYSPLLPSKRPSVPATLTFVNSHLAAFDEMVERRNADFHDLSRRLVFQYSIDSEVEDEDGVNQYPVNISVFETDVLFWMVDLNYRIDLTSEDIRQLLTWPGDKKRNLDELFIFDQLNNSARYGHAFEGFVEHPISHLPTYRFSSGLMADQLGYDMKRKPAWTDRILHMTSRTTPVRQLTYKGHPEITLSDHRPVSAEFIVSLDAIDLREYETTLKKLNRDVSDMEEQEAVPQVKVDPSSIDFGPIRYKQTSSKSFVVRNCGKVPCAFRFVSAGSGQVVHPGWLRVQPMTGLLPPDEAVTVNLVVEIGNIAASALNVFHEQLEFTLILHTVLGKDHFVSISAKYEPTCFANSLSHLVRLPGPIRSLKSEKHLLSEEEATNAPKEVMRLINWLMATDMDVDALFTSPGDQVLVDIICECLDTGQEFLFPEHTNPDQVALAFAETLVQLLDSLTESLIPPSLHQRCIEVSSKDEAFGLLEQLPPAVVNVLISVTAFLHFISQQSGDDARAKALASVFGPIVLRGDTISPLAKREFLLFFIT